MSRIKKHINGKPAINAGLPVIGKIKVGAKSEKGYPISLDYFRADGKYESIFKEVYGERPNKLTVIFVSNDISQVCNQRYELRDNKGNLYGYGDGEIFNIYSQKIDEYVSVNHNDYPDLLEQAHKKSGSKKGWEMTLTLRFILLDIKGVFGLWQFTTKGQLSSIPSIIETFDTIQEKAGTIVGIPFDLQVEKVKSQKPNSKSNFPVVKLVSNIGIDNLQKLKEFKDQGIDVNKIGALTDSKINEIEIKQLNQEN